MYEDAFKYPNPNSIADKPYSIKTPMKENNKNPINSAAVANCIRALTQKTESLTQENKELRQKNFLITQELEEIRLKGNNDLSYREKCLVLEHSNEIFQKKIIQLMETTENYESLKSEMILIHEKLSKEIDKNKKLTSENIKLKEKDFEINQCESFGDIVRNSQKGIHPDNFNQAALEKTNFLSSLIKKLQIELENKTNHTEVLKLKISDLESTCYRLQQEKQKSEMQKQEAENLNTKLLKALKKKNHICRHRSSTPDLPSTQSIINACNQTSHQAKPSTGKLLI